MKMNNLAYNDCSSCFFFLSLTASLTAAPPPSLAGMLRAFGALRNYTALYLTWDNRCTILDVLHDSLYN